MQSTIYYTPSARKKYTRPVLENSKPIHLTVLNKTARSINPLRSNPPHIPPPSPFFRPSRSSDPASCSASHNRSPGASVSCAGPSIPPSRTISRILSPGRCISSRSRWHTSSHVSSSRLCRPLRAPKKMRSCPPIPSSPPMPSSAAG